MPLGNNSILESDFAFTKQGPFNSFNIISKVHKNKIKTNGIKATIPTFTTCRGVIVGCDSKACCAGLPQQLD